MQLTEPSSEQTQPTPFVFLGDTADVLTGHSIGVQIARPLVWMLLLGLRLRCFLRRHLCAPLDQLLVPFKSQGWCRNL
jgi:hypothetical protein